MLNKSDLGNGNSVSLQGMYCVYAFFIDVRQNGGWTFVHRTVSVLLVLSHLLLLCVFSNAYATEKFTVGASESFATLQRQSMRQSILFRVEGETLVVVKHITHKYGEGARSSAVDQVQIMPTASLNAEATFNTQRGRSKINAGNPYVVWMNSDGDVIEVTGFEDPRLLRSPQQGSLPHSAGLRQSDGFFLLRGPALASAMHVHLPDRSLLSSLVQPSELRVPAESTARSANPVTGVAARHVDFGQHAWFVTLSQDTAR